MTSWQALGIGVGLGLGAGITPGPLLGLVITETLRGGWRAGVLVALAPPIADLVVIALCFFVLAHLPLAVFPLLGLGGGLYVMFLGWETLWTAVLPIEPGAEAATTARRSLSKGVTVNLLNPHPYIFWLTVGGPLVTQSYQHSALLPIAAFVGGFYVCLVGFKVLIALLIHGGRARLQGRGYRLALQVSGGGLLVLGALLLWEGVQGLW